MEISTRQVVDNIKSDYADVNEFDDLVCAWTALCEQASQSSDGEHRFADVEAAAIAALTASPQTQSVGQVGLDISRMINSFDYPTYLVTSQGLIAACNLAAWKEFDLDIGDSIDQIPFTIENTKTLSRLIEGELRNTEQADKSSLLLTRSRAREGEHDATIAMSVSRGNAPSALVFIITTKWRANSITLLQQQFGLTRTETDVLISFIDGHSTQDIATLRSRSHETIRVQFQSIREKLGARNQTELLRTVLSLSDFSKSIDTITNAVEHPFRRKTENITPSGRVIEATLMGNFTGDPIVMIASGSCYTFNAEFEQHLQEKNLLLISVCPPGYGNTDQTPAESTWRDQISDDVIAILNQLQINKCVMLIKHTNAAMSYYTAQKYSSRFSHIVQVATCGPIYYDKPVAGRSAWVSGMINACLNNNSLKGIIAKGAVKAWVTFGARQFMRLQMASNPVDAKHALKPENIIEYEHALNTASLHGTSDLLKEHELAFTDWRAMINAVSVEITAIHGQRDKLFSIESVRALVNDFSRKMNLVTVPKAGFTVAQSHADKVVAILRGIVDTQHLSGEDNLTPPDHRKARRA